MASLQDETEACKRRAAEQEQELLAVENAMLEMQQSNEGFRNKIMQKRNAGSNFEEDEEFIQVKGKIRKTEETISKLNREIDNITVEIKGIDQKVNYSFA